MTVKITGLDDLVGTTGEGYSGELKVLIFEDGLEEDLKLVITVSEAPSHEAAIDRALVGAEEFVEKLLALVLSERDRLK
jgi:hypothetical protein